MLLESVAGTAAGKLALLESLAGVTGHCCGAAHSRCCQSSAEGKLTVLESAANGVEMLAPLEAPAAADRALLQGSSQHLAMCPPFSEEHLCCTQSGCG